MEYMVCAFGEPEEIEYIPTVLNLGAGVELQSYGLKGCSSLEQWDDRKQLHLNFRKYYHNRLAVHGPFLGIEYAYTDHLLKRAVDKRMEMTLQTVKQLKAERVILHTGFKREVFMFNYRGKWLKDTSEYWKKEIKRYDKLGVTVVLENVVEFDPQIMIELHDAVNHPRLKLCLDIGHVNVWSKFPPALWIEKFGNRLAHVHVHDNHGVYDEHLPIGKGNVDFQAVFRALKEVVPNVTASLEVISDIDTVLDNLNKMIEIGG